VLIFGRRIPVPRRVAYYGAFAYAYSGIVHPARDLPESIDRLRRGIEHDCDQPFNTVLLNLYRDGADSVGWHSDNDYPNGGHPAVASISLGATRRFRFAPRRGGGPGSTIPLSSGDLLLMLGRSQVDYRHALPCTSKPTGPRINLTFRYMVEPNLT
jgi:alkylated DNA repair dioxygenase AlkB